MKYSVCIPMYNEISIIAKTAKTLSDYMEGRFEDYEILFSDDGSKDGCKEAVEALGLKNVRAIGYEANAGKGKAVREAVLHAEGDIILFTDADLAFGTDVIEGIFKEMEQNPDADMLIGSRAIHPEGYEGYTAIRKLTSKVYLGMLKLFGGLKVSDSQCGCKAFRAKAGKEVFSRCIIDGFAFDLEVILRMQNRKSRILEYPIKIVNHRESKVNIFRDTIRMLKDLRRIKKQLKKESKENEGTI